MFTPYKGRKGGREEGTEGGRKGGRKEGREGGRKGGWKEKGCLANILLKSFGCYNLK